MKHQTQFHQIDQLYRRYAPMVHRRCLHLLKNDQRAADALQDVFVQMLRHPKGLAATSPASLLYRIATNVCLNRLRGHRVRDEDGRETALSVIANAEDPETQVSVIRFLDKVFGLQKPSTRTIAVLHYIDGMTLEEVAAETQMSVSGVRKRLQQLKNSAARLEENK